MRSAVMVGLSWTLLNVTVPEVSVTAALGLKTKVEVPALRVPVRVNRVLVVAVRVIVEPLAVKVAPVAKLILPEVSA